ncbi:MAG: DUF4837 family protein [Bacteroidales bacterium]|nr:DUF4837 family protein [Bacteroidales bacterium]
MTSSRFLIFAILLLLIISCKNDQQPLLPSVGGMPGDVTLVMDKADWEGPVGDEYRRILGQYMAGLPQDEELFNLIFVPASAFDKLFRPQRNILITKISPSYKESKIIVQKDVWAKPQIVLNVLAANDSALLQLLKDSEEKMVALLENMERQRLMTTYKKNQNKGLKLRIEKEHNVTLTIPNGYNIYVDSADFVWMGQERGEGTMGICIYHYNYTDPNTFTPEYLIAKRDSFVGNNIPTEKEGAVMLTEREFPPRFTELSLRNKQYIAELRGLWKVDQGLIMGGPFVSITTLDEKRNQVITVEGFAYAPGQNKRELVRQLEAVIYSLEIPDGQKD